MKKIALAIFSIGFVLSFTGCKWQIPEKVSVKSTAEYNFSLGTYEKTLDSEMDKDSIMGDAGVTNEDVTIYDYFPGKKDKNTQHYLFQVKVYEVNLAEEIPGLANAINNPSLAADDVINFSTDTIVSPLVSGFNQEDQMGLGFNPSSIISGMTEGLGTDFTGKVSFADVPLYLYCEAPGELKTTADIKMFYGSGDPFVKTAGTDYTPIISNMAIGHKPLPALTKDGDAVITDLNTTTYIGNVDEENRTTPIDITSLVNATTTGEEELGIYYKFTGVTGTITKADAQRGLTLKVYAVIDFPLSLRVLADLDLDLKSMTQDIDEVSGATQIDNPTSSAGDSEYAKYLKIIDSVSIKYIAYKLPVYAKKNSSLKLGIDLLGNGKFVYEKLTTKEKNKTITDSDKSVIKIPYTTIKELKNATQLNPNIKVLISKDSEFSIPREKAVDMHIEMSLKTDGTLQVK